MDAQYDPAKEHWVRNCLALGVYEKASHYVARS